MMSWKQWPMWARLVALGGIGFVLGSLAQAELDQGYVPSVAGFVLVVVAILVIRQGWGDGDTNP